MLRRRNCYRRIYFFRNSLYLSMEVKNKKLTPEETRIVYQKMMDRKARLRKHIENGKKLSDLSKDEFEFVQPI